MLLLLGAFNLIGTFGPARTAGPFPISVRRTARRDAVDLRAIAASYWFQSAQASISRECNGAHTSLPVSLLASGTATSIWLQEADMARKPDRLAFVFAMVLAMAITILASKTWADPPDPDSDSAAPIPPRETIYRPERWNVY
jgi:hypothetical protein